MLPGSFCLQTMRDLSAVNQSYGHPERTAFRGPTDPHSGHPEQSCRSPYQNSTTTSLQYGTWLLPCLANRQHEANTSREPHNADGINIRTYSPSTSIRRIRLNGGTGRAQTRDNSVETEIRRDERVLPPFGERIRQLLLRGDVRARRHEVHTRSRVCVKECNETCNTETEMSPLKYFYCTGLASSLDATCHLPLLCGRQTGQLRQTHSMPR